MRIHPDLEDRRVIAPLVAWSDGVLLPGARARIDVHGAWTHRAALGRVGHERIAVGSPRLAMRAGDARDPSSTAVCLGRIEGIEIVSRNRGLVIRRRLLVRGIARGRLVEEVAARPMRIARIERLDEIESVTPIVEFARRELLSALRQLLDLAPETALAWDHLSGLDAPLDVLTDDLAVRLPLAVDVRRDLLAESRIARRAARLATAIGRLAWRVVADSEAVLEPVLTSTRVARF